MIKNKEDKRIKYTKMFLKEALIDLMQNKPVDQISITELCNKADINRNTFYSHFTTVHDVLIMIENDMEEELLNGMNLQLHSKAVIAELFENINKYGNIYRVLLSSNGDMGFMQSLYSKIEKIVIADFIKDQIILDDEKMEMLFSFLFFGSMSIVKKWVDTGSVQSPQNMADFVCSIATSSVEPFKKL